ncbi:ADP-ribosylation factor family-domain-containing protein [Mycena sp. CBHHK59/15]|nr:ADP-ribosylation factor family-domain-containing protein [Mycena sp. CBHHK59/15]
MNLTLRRLVDRFYPRPRNGHKIPFLGLDGSGKTTFLYRLKLGEIIVTIPTIGFNVETVQVQAHGKTGMRGLMELSCWDVGGCSSISPSLKSHYAAGSDALIWLVDSCDKERLAESVDEFSHFIRTLAADPGLGGGKQKDVPVLMQDRPGAMSIGEIRSKFSSVISGLSVLIVGTSLKQSLTEGALPEAFGWLLDAIENFRGKKPLSSTSAPPNPRSPTALETKFGSWLIRAASDSSADEFLKQFEAIDLPSWDHYTHIRIAYLILTRFGRQKGKDMIFRGIEKYIAQSPQTGEEPSIMPPSISDTASISVSSSATLVDDEVKGEKPGDDFVRFLLLNPFVADGNLWAEYYSKEVIMSPEGKAGMVLPDKKPLPNLVSREAVPSVLKPKDSK